MAWPSRLWRGAGSASRTTRRECRSCRPAPRSTARMHCCGSGAPWRRPRRRRQGDLRPTSLPCTGGRRRCFVTPCDSVGPDPRRQRRPLLAHALDLAVDLAVALWLRVPLAVPRGSPPAVASSAPVTLVAVDVPRPGPAAPSRRQSCDPRCSPFGQAQAAIEIATLQPEPAPDVPVAWSAPSGLVPSSRPSDRRPTSSRSRPRVHRARTTGPRPRASTGSRPSSSRRGRVRSALGHPLPCPVGSPAEAARSRARR